MLDRSWIPIMESTLIDKKRYIAKLKEETPFYNAIRTADDKVCFNGKTYTNFIDLWKDTTGLSEDDIGYLCANRDCPHEDDIMAYDLQGAHIVLEKRTGPIQKGEKFCIVPLCPLCNHHANRSKMILRYDVDAPVLTWDGK